MSCVKANVRRSLVLLMLLAGVGVAARWWMGRTPADTAIDPPVWPPLRPVPTAAAETWQPALHHGSAPGSHPVKVKESSGIYHVPGGRFYDRTNADRYYATTDAAEADGYRRSKA